MKDAILPKALEYLVSKIRSKGKEIEYSELKMAEYLMPNLENISIDDRRQIFQIRNRMLPIPSKFPSDKSEIFNKPRKDYKIKNQMSCVLFLLSKLVSVPEL